MRVDPTLIFSADSANQPEIDFSVIEMSESEPGHTIYASSNNLQLHDSQKNQAIPPLRSSQTIDLGKKHMWIIAYHSSDQFASTSRREMYVATAVGPLITLMLAVLLISFRHAEKKAKALSIGMTAELSASVAQVVRLALVATHTSNAVIFTDTQRITTWVNAGFTRITGYSPQEIIGMSPGERLQCPSTNPETIQAMRTALNAGLGCKAEIINRKKSGEDFWYEMDIVPLHSPAGELTGFMALGLDITNRKKNELRLAEQAKRSERALNELNRAQAELKKNVTRLALATEAGQIGIWDWNIETNALKWDTTMLSLYGLPAGTEIKTYECWSDALHPNDRQRCEEEVRQALAGERPLDTEYRIQWPDGSTHDLRGRGTVIRDKNGKPVQMIGANWDITQLKADNNRLKLFSRAVEQSPTSVVITDTNAKIEYVNKTFSRITGYSSAEALGQNPRLLKSGETSGAEYLEMWSTITQGKTWSGEFHNLTKDRKPFWQASTITPIRSESGRISHYLAINEDITERRSFEATLAHERWLLNCLMETVPALIYFKDQAGRYLQVNKALASALNTSPDKIRGRTAAEFYPPAETARILASEQHIRETGRSLLDKIEHITDTDGTIHWFSSCKMPLRSETGEITGTFGLSTDITVQKKSDQERANLQIQLSQAQKMESVGMLASGIAHEMNTPSQFVADNLAYVGKTLAQLDPILAAHPRLLEALNATAPLAPEVDEWLKALPKVKIDYMRREIPAALDDARDGMGRITHIVKAMKSFSHPSSEKAALADLNQAIENTLIVCRNEWKYVATLETQLDPTLPQVPCHLSDFNQVVINLVINAAQAIGEVVAKAPGTQGRITVSTQRVEDWAEVRISDTGTGIPESARTHLFTPFFTTKEVGKGTGQGLALARSVIVDRHKGTLAFETELGCGTTFVIRLPLVAPKTEATTEIA